MKSRFLICLGLCLCLWGCVWPGIDNRRQGPSVRDNGTEHRTSNVELPTLNHQTNTLTAPRTVTIGWELDTNAPIFAALPMTNFVTWLEGTTNLRSWYRATTNMPYARSNRVTLVMKPWEYFRAGLGLRSRQP